MYEGIYGFHNIMKAFSDIAKKHFVNEKEFHKTIDRNLPFSIKKAVLFPFNKEMHSLLRFSSDINFEIVGVYDSKYSANVGATTSHIMKSSVKSITIPEYRKYTMGNI